MNIHNLEDVYIRNQSGAQPLDLNHNQWCINTAFALWGRSLPLWLQRHHENAQFSYYTAGQFQDEVSTSSLIRNTLPINEVSLLETFIAIKRYILKFSILNEVVYLNDKIYWQFQHNRRLPLYQILKEISGLSEDWFYCTKSPPPSKSSNRKLLTFTVHIYISNNFSEPEIMKFKKEIIKSCR
jgi:hypothetical protein